jgi:hypothetical protein
MKKPATAIALLALALGPAATAGAAGKQRIVAERFSEPYEFVAVDCSTVGPYDFEILVTVRQRVQVTDVLSSDGELLQTVFSIGINETDTNTVTGASITLKGTAYEVWDYASNTRTVSGRVWDGHDGGKLFFDAGRIEMTLDTHEAFFVAGPHEIFFGGGIDPFACAALAG